MPTRRFGLVLSCLGLSIAACGSDEDTQGTYRDPLLGVDGGVGDGGGTDAGWGSSDGGAQGGDSSVDPGPDFESCAGTVAEAEQKSGPVNVVWVVDNSGSMDQEAAEVQKNMNAFAQKIGMLGVDYRVVLITKRDEFNLVVPPPLGNDAQHFLYVDHNVDSDEPLDDLLTQYASYSSFLLKNATTHFIVVTDDESSITASKFIADMKSRMGNAPFKVHAIASEEVPGREPICLEIPFVGRRCFGGGACESAFGRAAAAGVQNYAAATMTGGLTLSICTEDWSGLFDKLSSAVSAPVPCELAIPQPADGQTLNPSLVNLLFKAPEQATSSVVPAVTASAQCGTAPGWFYDDPANPKRIILCPASCTLAEKGGKLELKLGCGQVLR